MSQYIQQQIKQDLTAAFQSFVTQLTELPDDANREERDAILAAAGERLHAAVDKLSLLDEQDQLLEHLAYTWSQVAAGVMLAAEVCYRMQNEQRQPPRPTQPPGL